ncbi:MAG TPA: hypothetical protein VG223_08245 [Solirubrobacteraceae bacterium]|nr:hypothetical protein [Solirubrobacteraceae bacterium]
MVETLKQWLSEHPPPAQRFTQSLAGVALRVRAGENFFVATRELLDEFALAPADAIRRRAIELPPGPTGTPRYDAYLGALGEHLAVRHRLAIPPWTACADRFLDRFWFVSDVKGFRALLLTESPAAFRRRGIFVSERSLIRV